MKPQASPPALNQNMSKSNNQGKVSVVMAVYNAELYLAQAVDSILGQSFTDFEFIVINDGSSDRSAQILSQYSDPRLKVYEHHNQGLAASLNRGIRASDGIYIARMDADDISEPERLKKQIKFLDDQPEYVLVGTKVMVMTDEGIPLYQMGCPLQDDELREVLNRGTSSPFVHGSVMFRKSVAIACGLYHEKMKTAQDLLLWRQMTKLGKVANLPDDLYRYRITPTAISSRPRSASVLKMKVVRRIADSGRVSEKDLRDLQKIDKDINPRLRRSWYELRMGKIYQARLLNQQMARHHFTKAIRANPFNINAWVNWIFSHGPIKWVRALKHWRYKGPKSMVTDIQQEEGRCN